MKYWLNKEETYTLHKRSRRKIKRNRVVVDGMTEQWIIDLMDMSDFAEENEGNKFVLMVIDVFSQYFKNKNNPTYH